MKDNFRYLMITNDPYVAAELDYYGVHRIFIDLEINGKQERQGHLNTVISHHSFDDISKVKQALTNSELLVRINPYHNESQTEIDEVIARGADIIMLPMFRTMSEVIEVGKLISGRAKLIPLVETVAATNLLKELDESQYVDEIHIGLNDLHLELGLSFMFELLENGYLESRLLGLKKPFGIGGIARATSGDVDGYHVMAEHIRLGSQGVILSRAFHQEISREESGCLSMVSFQEEFSKLKAVRKELLECCASRIEELHSQFCHKVQNIKLKER